MKIEVCLRLSSCPPHIREKLCELFPKYAGPHVHFTFQGSRDSQDYRDILSFLYKEGYSIGPPLVLLDYSKQFLIQTVFRFEEHDLNVCEYFSLESVKKFGYGQLDAIILDNVALINKPVIKFKYVISGGSGWFMTKTVKEALESERFEGVLFYPVELVKGDPDSPEKWRRFYSEKARVSSIPNIFALSSSVKIDYDCHMSGVDHFFRTTLLNTGRFDLAISKDPGGPMYCSQRFYRFWKEHFEDLEFSPMIVA
jgi:hypothetical protein